jgi:transcriptional regulator with XRE-family HTH domain
LGRASRPKPERLPDKLRLIREALGLSQEAMLALLTARKNQGLFQGSVSGYELGTREPPLKILLEYARAANVYVEVLIDDELSLPPQLPAKRKSEGIPAAGSSLKDSDKH